MDAIPVAVSDQTSAELRPPHTRVELLNPGTILLGWT